MITILKRRSTTKNERDWLNKQGELVKAHNKGKLGRTFYTEDKTGVNTGTKGRGYLSPVRLRGRV